MKNAKSYLLSLSIALIASLSLCARENMRIVLRDWELANSSLVNSQEAEVSLPSFDTQGWIPVTVPSTVLNALVQAGIYPDPRVGMNNYLIPDASDIFNEKHSLTEFSYLPDKRNPWKDPYWYRTVFTLRKTSARERIWLNFNGINYRADVYVNGKKIADSKDVVGMFRRFRFDVTDYVHVGENCIAVRIHQTDHPGTPTPGTQFIVFGPNRGTSQEIFQDETLKLSGGWDCAPVVRDRNMGIWQDVYIETTGAVTVDDPFVITKLRDIKTEDGMVKDTSSASLTIEATLKNHSSKSVKGRLKVTVSYPEKTEFPTYTLGTGAKVQPIELSCPVELAPGAEQTLRLNPEKFPALAISSPRLWWPNGYGRQDMYLLSTEFITSDGRVSDTEETAFGIREVGSYLHEKNGEYGRVFTVNGKRIFCKGGWLQPDALLANSPKNIYDQARLLAMANVNLVGSEDMPSPPAYWLDSFDKYGLMDWHVFHQCYRMFPGRNTQDNPTDKKLATECVKDMVKRYRNHPSIIAWFGVNEVLMNKELYDSTKEAALSLDESRPYIPTTSISWDVDKLTPYLKDDLPTGTTDDGAPDYNWAPSEYYFSKVNEVHLQMFRNELGMPSVPVYESLKKFIPTIDKPRDAADPIFPLDSNWAEHGAWDANNFCYRAYDNAIRTFYSDPVSGKDYAFKGQIVSAEGYRAMFEAANHRMWDITTGVMIWKLNSCWPDVCWQTYDWYLSPNASYYFSKKALEPIHIQMNADSRKVSVINTTGKAAENVTIKAELIDMNMKCRWQKTEKITAKADGFTQTAWMIPSGSKLPGVYFIRLHLIGSDGSIISENLYWRYSQHQNYRWLTELQKPELKTDVRTEKDGKEYHITLDITNDTDALSFFRHLTVRKGDSGQTVNPVFWSDNFITLFPGESKTVTAIVAIEDLQGEEPAIYIE